MGLLTVGGRRREAAPALGRPGPGAVAPQPVRLIVGFDDSESARRALAWGVNLLRGGGGAVHVIYADRVILASDLPGFARAGMDEARDEKAAQVAASAAQIAAAAGVPHTFECRRESPAKALVVAADAEVAGPPVIVVGRSRDGAGRAIGSVPGRLLRRSPHPVLIIS